MRTGEDLGAVRCVKGRHSRMGSGLQVSIEEDSRCRHIVDLGGVEARRGRLSQFAEALLSRLSAVLGAVIPDAYFAVFAWSRGFLVPSALPYERSVCIYVGKCFFPMSAFARSRE